MSNFSGNELNKKVTLPLIAKYKNKRAELKKAIKDPQLPLADKIKLIGQLHRLPKKSSPTRYRTRCLFSYKSGSVDRRTGLGYFQLRRLASEGKLPGYRRASW
jgi:small subunit ribosomal protein S14